MTDEELSKYFMTIFLKTFVNYQKKREDNAEKPRLCLTEEEEEGLLGWERLE